MSEAEQKVKAKWPDAYAFLSKEWRGWIILPSRSSSATLRNLLSSAGGSEQAAWADAAKRIVPSDRSKRYKAELWQDGICVAAVDCPTYQDMRREIEHYALMYEQDGAVEIREATK